MAAPTVEARPVGDVAGAPPPAARRRGRPGRLGDFVLRLVAALVLVYLFIPIAVIVAFSFNDPSGKFNLTWQGFTLDNWADPFRYSQLTDALWTSLQVAALSTAVAIVLGTLVAVALVRQRFTGDKFVETFLVLPLTAPEVVHGGLAAHAVPRLRLEPGVRHDRHRPHRVRGQLRRARRCGPGSAASTGRSRTRRWTWGRHRCGPSCASRCP